MHPRTYMPQLFVFILKMKFAVIEIFKIIIANGRFQNKLESHLLKHALTHNMGYNVL